MAISREMVYNVLMNHFFERTERVNDCLLWVGRVSVNGYSIYETGGVKYVGHRYAWQQLVGEIPKGMIIHHECHNKRCVNIAHLRLTTRSEHMSSIHHNTKAATEASAKSWRSRTHCKNGHLFSPSNTRTDKHGSRVCRACSNYHSMLYKRRKRLEGTYKW